MIPQPQQGGNNAETERALEELPEKVGEALMAWRKATLNRERVEALALLRFKAEDRERPATEIKALVHSDAERYQSVLDEIVAEGLYTKLLETLLSAKKIASIRTAF